MAVRQFLITVIVKAKGISIVDGAEVEFEHPHHIQIDLVRDSVDEFLSKIPDDISECSAIEVAITRADGETLAYHDGMLTFHRGEGWLPWQRTSLLGEVAMEGARLGAKNYAKALLELKEAEEKARSSQEDP